MKTTNQYNMETKLVLKNAAREALVEPKHLLHKAKNALKWGFYETAIHHANSFLLFNPKHLDAMLVCAYAKLYMGKEEQALHLMNELMKDHSTKPQVWEALAVYYAATFEEKLAEDYLYQALAIARNIEEKTGIILTLAQVFDGSGEHQLATLTVNEALELSPFDEDAHFVRAKLLMKQNNFELAKRSLDIVLQLNKEHAEAFRERARCWMMLNKVAYGLNDIKKAQQVELNRHKNLEATY